MGINAVYCIMGQSVAWCVFMEIPELAMEAFAAWIFQQAMLIFRRVRRGFSIKYMRVKMR